MSTSSTTTAETPAPISPFSSLHSLSEATSDEQPDLGAFRTVFRALSDLHPPLPILPRRHVLPTTPTQSSAIYTTPRSTVWAHNVIQSYLQSQTEDTDSSVRPPRPHSASSLPESHTTPPSDTTERRIVEIHEMDSFNEEDEDDVQVSLGYLNETLSFIAAERQRLAALRPSGHKSPTSGGTTTTSTSESEPRPAKPRRKRTKNSVKNDDDSVDGDYSSQSDPKTSPVTPRGGHKARMKRVRSTPSLRDLQPPNLSSASSTSLDPRISRLRSLASKLRVHFPAEAKYLKRVLRSDQPDSDDFVDPRGPAPTPDAPFVHIFIDHSNILIGLLNYIKRHPRLVPSPPPRRPKHLSHSALSLILERGRPITRRVLVASSPLYQPMDTATRLGYEVRVYARVPRDDSPLPSSSSAGAAPSPSRRPSRHARKPSSSTSATESSEQPPPTRLGHIRRSSDTSAVQSASTTPSASRVRYREQGVDELLQLKIHDALAQVDGPPPPGSTIVLATGDGNAGQFSDDGFLGPVRVALRKGWHVELVAWEEAGLARAWKREFEGEERFRIIGMERFAADLVDYV